MGHLGMREHDEDCPVASATYLMVGATQVPFPGLAMHGRKPVDSHCLIFCRLFSVVGASLFDCFRLGALRKGRVGQPGGERIALLDHRLDGLREPGPFSVEID